MNPIEVVVPHDVDGERADKVLALLLDSPRSTARRIIDAQDATIDGRPVRPAEKVPAGAVITVTIPPPPESVQPEDGIAYSVAYEDASIIVVDKPAGLVVHPGAGKSTGTLVSGLMDRYPEIAGVGQEDRWGIVHRLDRDTSGLLVVARTQEVYQRLIEMMKNREVTRRYISLVQGAFTNTVGTIDAPIGRDPQNPTRMHVTRSGRPARTHYRRLAHWSGRDATLLSLTLETGRTHQIRVHMSAIGHQIIGDGVYGRRGVLGDPGRTWLHARELGLRHPESGEEHTFVSSLPEDLLDSLAELGEPETGSVADIDGGSL